MMMNTTTTNITVPTITLRLKLLVLLLSDCKVGLSVIKLKDPLVAVLM